MTRTAQSTPRDAGRPAAASGSGFRVRWDRTIIALVALLAVLTFVVTGLAAVFGAGTGAVAAVSALVAVAGVVSLRALVLRDRKARRDRRIEQAFTEAMNPALPAADRTPARPAGSAPVFDGASGSPASEAVDADAPATELSPTPGGAPAETIPATTPADGNTTLPSVPRPTYLDAPEAHRPVPEPLESPEPPAAQPGTKLKSGVSEEYLAQVQATAKRTLDLDKVLERRRAI